MTTLSITDLPRADTLHRHEMSAVRGGIATLINPNPGPTLPSMPSLPLSSLGATLLKEINLSIPWPAQHAPAAQDPRLL